MKKIMLPFIIFIHPLSWGWRIKGWHRYMRGGALCENVGFPSANRCFQRVSTSSRPCVRFPVCSFQHLRISWRHAKNTWQEDKAGSRGKLDEKEYRQSWRRFWQIWWESSRRTTNNGAHLSPDHEYEYMRGSRTGRHSVTYMGLRVRKGRKGSSLTGVFDVRGAQKTTVGASSKEMS